MWLPYTTSMPFNLSFVQRLSCNHKRERYAKASMAARTASGSVRVTATLPHETDLLATRLEGLIRRDPTSW